MAMHSSTLAWKIPWMEEPGRLQSMGRRESDMTERLHFHFSLSCIGEGNGNPLQCSCLEDPRDRGACRAAIYGVAQSRTRLKRLSSSSSSSFFPWDFNLEIHFLRKTFPNSKGNMWSLPLQFFIDLIWLNLSKVAIFLSFKKICLWFFILTGNDIANFYLIHHWILCILAYSSWCMCGSVIQYMCIFGKILCGIYSQGGPTWGPLVS